MPANAPPEASSARLRGNSAPLRDNSAPLGDSSAPLVGNSAPFPIGSNAQAITMPANGVLYLGVNDDGFPDNRGNFQVIVR